MPRRSRVTAPRRSIEARTALCARLVATAVAGVLRRAAEQLVNLNARVSDRLEPRLRILPPDIGATVHARAEASTAGSAVQSGSRSITFASTSEIVSPSKARRPVEHLEEHDAERPHVRALVGRPAPRLLGAHVCRRPEDDAFFRPAGRQRRRLRHIGGAASPEAAFARPKSRTFTTPSGVSLILAGFRSR